MLMTFTLLVSILMAAVLEHCKAGPQLAWSVCMVKQPVAAAERKQGGLLASGRRPASNICEISECARTDASYSTLACSQHSCMMF